MCYGCASQDLSKWIQRYLQFPLSWIFSAQFPLVLTSVPQAKTSGYGIMLIIKVEFYYSKFCNTLQDFIERGTAEVNSTRTTTKYVLKQKK